MNAVLEDNRRFLNDADRPHQRRSGARVELVMLQKRWSVTTTKSQEIRKQKVQSVLHFLEYSAGVSRATPCYHRSKQEAKLFLNFR